MYIKFFYVTKLPKSHGFVKICIEKSFILKNFIKNNWQILLPQLLVITIFIIFYGKFGDLMIDSYREIYMANQVVAGKVLYKDIFTIYPPLSYLINALFVKVFGSSLFVFYIAGLLTTLGILFITYKIANYFTDKNISLAICLFLIAGLVLSPNVFNAFLPYSYGILYGVLFILSSIYFALNRKYPLAYLFYSLAMLSKYEFILFLPLLMFYTKKQDLVKNLIALFFPILLTSIYFKSSGLNIDDILATIQIIKAIGQTKTLHWFYETMGLVFRWDYLGIYLINLVKFILPLSLIIFIKKLYNTHSLLKIEHYHFHFIAYPLITIIIAYTLFSNNTPEIIIYAFPLITILLAIRFKNISFNERFFVLATLLISLKIYWGMVLASYGSYFIPFALISFFILTPIKIQKYLCTTLILWSIGIGISNGITLYEKDVKKLDNIIEYVKNNTKPSDTVVVYPECLAINVASNRKGDNKFYSLIPLYTETFGEDLISARIVNIKPEYILINNYDTGFYGPKEFGYDYGVRILDTIKENYTLINTIESGWKFKIYKLKN